MRLVSAAAALWLIASSAIAADVRVLTAGAFKSVLSAVVPGFEQRTGHHVLIETDTAGGVAQQNGGAATCRPHPGDRRGAGPGGHARRPGTGGRG